MDQTAELERKVRQLSTLLEVSRALNADLELERVLHTVLEQAIMVMEAEAGTLWSLEEHNTIIVPRVATGPAAASIFNVRLAPGEGIAGQVIQTGDGILVSDAQSDPRWAERVDEATGFMTRSIVCGPLTGHSGTIGCLQLLNKRDNRLFDPSDVEILTALGAQAALVIENSRLLEQTRAFARNLEEAWTGTLDALTSAMACRDTETLEHCYRTVELAVMLARRMGISDLQLATIARGALLHDIGKIGIPDHILLKPGRLTDEERETMKQHVKLGYDMLKHVTAFQDALPVVLYHHENYDGSGYLSGIKGEAIPLAARIFHAVDVYDALISSRPYKPPWSHEQALAEIRSVAGKHFDPLVVDALEQLTPEETDTIHRLEDFLPGTRALLGRTMVI